MQRSPASIEKRVWRSRSGLPQMCLTAWSAHCQIRRTNPKTWSVTTLARIEDNFEWRYI